MRRLVVLFAVLGLAACGGGDRQDANEPEGEFRVEVVSAEFPERQHIAEDVELVLRVRNADDEDLSNVAVTVETQAEGENAPISFGQRSNDPQLADSGRPIWVLAEGPRGGETAIVNTWTAGPLRAGEERELTWSLVPSRAGTFTIDYRVAPGLQGRARPAEGNTSGSFSVTIDDEPVPARVGADGEVERETEPGSDSN